MTPEEPRSTARDRAEAIHPPSRIPSAGLMAVTILTASAHGSAAADFDRDHSAWTAVPSKYVRDGDVDYQGLAGEGRASFDAYLRSLQAASAFEPTWSRDERMAFWINAYNAFTIRLVLDHYPLKSIRSIGLLPGAAFRKKFIPLGKGGEEISLDTIEHEILRAQFQDARIHFAIVCASKSCPALRSEAYRARDLPHQLDDAARGFLADPSKNRLDVASGTLQLSPIFKWFREDFERDAGSLEAFVARHASPADAERIGATKTRLVFLDYDWSLNRR